MFSILCGHGPRPGPKRMGEKQPIWNIYQHRIVQIFKNTCPEYICVHTVLAHVLHMFSADAFYGLRVLLSVTNYEGQRSLASHLQTLKERANPEELNHMQKRFHELPRNLILLSIQHAEHLLEAIRKQQVIVSIIVCKLRWHPTMSPRPLEGLPTTTENAIWGDLHKK